VQGIRLKLARSSSISVFDILLWDDEDGWTALMRAVNRHQLAKVRVLLASGADATLKNDGGEFEKP
jgi:ankyrin repeat protein